MTVPERFSLVSVLICRECSVCIYRCRSRLAQISFSLAFGHWNLTFLDAFSTCLICLPGLLQVGALLLQGMLCFVLNICKSWFNSTLVLNLVSKPSFCNNIYQLSPISYYMSLSRLQSHRQNMPLFSDDPELECCNYYWLENNLCETFFFSASEQ